MIKLLPRACVLLLAALLTTPLFADDKHDKWIDVLSIDWGSARVGQPISMADGNYKNSRGQYLIVEGGKVKKKGPDFRAHQPRGSATGATRGRSNKPASESSLRSVATSQSTTSPGSGDTEDIGAPSARPKPRGIEHEDIGGSAPRSGGKENEDHWAETHALPGTERQDTPPQLRVDSRSIGETVDRSQPGIEEPDFGAPKAGTQEAGDGVTTPTDVMPRSVEKSSPMLMKSLSSNQMSTQQMMLKLRYRPGLAAKSGGGSSGAADKVAAPGQVQNYETEDCGTPESPMVCCHHEAGDGSTCNMFKMLCKNAGGTADGDPTDATCSDWP